MNYSNLSLKLFCYISALILFSSCANIIPPSGGPRDSLPPVMIISLPKDSTINFNSKKITLTFDEYIEAKDIQQNVIMNPLPNSMPLIDYKLRNVFITLKDSLEANTTYTINFGDAIKDVNEGNILKNKTYVFSTGGSIDNGILTGKVLLANDGKVDSTLIVALYSNLNDTAVLKLRPRYIAKLDGNGAFKFTNLPKNKFNAFVLPNDYSKKYDDSTKLFAFLNESVFIDDSVKQLNLFAYRQVEPKANTPSTQNITTKEKEDKKLRYTTNLVNSRLDILDSVLQINFNRKVSLLSKNAIELLDSNYKPIFTSKMNYDTIQKKITFTTNFAFATKYFIVINKDEIKDSLGIGFAKNDTIKFVAFGENDYGKIKIRHKQITNNGVLQVLKDGKIQNTFSLSTKEIVQDYFRPGEYELRVLIDENNNGVWDAGNYKLKIQPEKAIPVKAKLMVRANWDNEMDLSW